MGRKKPKYILTLQISNGTGPRIQFEIADDRAQDVIDLIQNDIRREQKKKKHSVVTLDIFFKDRSEYKKVPNDNL